VSTFTFSITAFLKPAASTVTWYRTGSRDVAVYEPASDVFSLNAWLVPRFVIVTTAPEITAPLGSTTVPLIPPLFVCPSATIALSSMTASVLILSIDVLLFFPSYSRAEPAFRSLDIEPDGCGLLWFASYTHCPPDGSLSGKSHGQNRENK